LSALRRHADLVLADGQRSIETADDVRDLRRRHAYFLAMTSGRAVIPLLAGR
jgi:hypothetical protein